MHNKIQYNIKALDYFINQVKNLDKKSREIIEDKIQFLKEDPYRFKRINSKQYKKVYRIRLNIQSKESRLIYVILEPNVVLVCLLDRKKDYKDLEKFLKNVKI